MKPVLFFISFILCSIVSFAQVKKSTVQITKELNKGVPKNDNLVIKFIGPTKQPVKSHVKMVVGNDTIFPEISATGVYKDHLDPGTYKVIFAVPYWYDATIEKLNCKKNENIYITVYFTPKDIGIK